MTIGTCSAPARLSKFRCVAWSVARPVWRGAAPRQTRSFAYFCRAPQNESRSPLLTQHVRNGTAGSAQHGCAREAMAQYTWVAASPDKRRRRLPHGGENPACTFEPRLWQFTTGLRWRIVAAVGVGVLATAFGIARLALLGWLIALVFSRRDLGRYRGAGDGPSCSVIVVRGWLEYLRTMMAHNTAARVQARLRQSIFDKVAQLGPAYFGLERTGDAVMAMIDGVGTARDLLRAVYPTAYRVGCSACDDLCLCRLSRLAGGAGHAGCRPGQRWLRHRFFKAGSTAGSLARSRSYKAFAAEFLDSVQGIATLKAFGQSGARAAMLRAKADDLFRSTMWVLATNSLGRGITDTGIAVGAAAALALGAYRVADGQMTLVALSMILMMGVRGVPAHT